MSSHSLAPAAGVGNVGVRGWVECCTVAAGDLCVSVGGSDGDDVCCCGGHSHYSGWVIPAAASCVAGSDIYSVGLSVVAEMGWYPSPGPPLSISLYNVGRGASPGTLRKPGGVGP